MVWALVHPPKCRRKGRAWNGSLDGNTASAGGPGRGAFGADVVRLLVDGIDQGFAGKLKHDHFSVAQNAIVENRVVGFIIVDD